MDLEQRIGIQVEKHFIHKNPIEFSKFSEDSENIEIYVCSNCTHRQTKYLLSDLYYEQLEESGGAIQYRGGLCKTKELIAKLKEFANSTEKLVEIGCGMGYGLVDAMEYFDYVVGIDPSKSEVEVAKEKDLNVICGFFNSDLKLEDTYSAFMSFQVFEHLTDIYEVLEYAYEILEDGGVGLINVPNGQYIFDNGLYHQVVCEHVNYFTPFSLAYCCNKAKFDVIEISPCKETMELNIYLRKKINVPKMEDCRSIQKASIKNMINKFENIGIYGAGAKAGKYMSLLDEEDISKIQYLFDGDSLKVGKYIWGLNIPIQMVSNSFLEAVDAIIIFASSYN